MRRTLLLMVISALLLTQCRKPAVELPTAEPANTVSMTITAGPGGKTDITDAGGITWSTGDRIYVGHGGTYVGYLTLQSGANSPTGTFTGSVTLPDGTTGEQTFHFFYLGSGSQTLTAGESTEATVSFASQTGLRGDLGSCHVGHGSAKGAVSAGGVTGISVMMKSEVALARFSFTDGTSPYAGALTLSGTGIYNSMKVNFGGTFTGETTDRGKINLTNTTLSEKYVMLVPAGAGSATLNFGGEYEGFTVLAQGIEANKYYGQGGPIEVVLTKAPVSVTGVTVAPTALNLVVGGTSTLTATVAPADATNKDVAWESDDTDVATVDGNGKVTAVAVGTAIITVTTADGGKKATCTVTVTAPAPTHETVNFGTPNLDWSVCNLGATNGETKESWYGDYYAWGATETWYSAGGQTSSPTWKDGFSDGYTWGHSPGNGGNSSYNADAFNTWKGDHLTNNVLNPEVDAATVAWGSDWRMPTKAEWEALYANNTFKWLAAGETDSETGFTAVAAGYLVVRGGKSSRALDSSVYMFLPAAGVRVGTNLSMDGRELYCWSCTLLLTPTVRAYEFGLEYGGEPVIPVRRNHEGMSVRPVHPAP